MDKTDFVVSMDTDEVNYVMGFFITPHGVMLIRKISPPAWAGKANGLGGKIRPNEAPVAAMVREFQEESGLLTIEAEWQLLTVVGGTPHRLNDYRNWTMHVFWATGGHFEALYQYRSAEGTASIYTNLPGNTDSTARWLYGLLRDYLSKGVVIKEVS